jgi:hypothetical protein
MQPFCRGKAISITYSECVFVALVICIECACALLSSVACRLESIFPHYLINGRIFGGGEEERLLNMKCVFPFSLQILSEIFPILRSCNSCQILIKLKFSWLVFEKYSNIKFLENIPVGVELFHAEGQTDITKLIDIFCNFANAPKNIISFHIK